jgi:hypothetical protein
MRPQIITAGGNLPDGMDGHNNGYRQDVPCVNNILEHTGEVLVKPGLVDKKGSL